MSLTVNTNTLALSAQNNLNNSQKSLNSAIERLSSGSKINSAKDNAAGEAIANRLSAQISGLNQASSNANDGISLAQTAEGALNQTNDNLQRIRQLTVQAQNGTNSQSDLDSIQNEISQRLEEINRVSDQTDFNGVKVLNGNKSISIQVGANDGQKISIDLKGINSTSLGLDGFNVNGNGSIQVKVGIAESSLGASKSLVSYSDANGATQYAIKDATDSANVTYAKANIDSVDGKVSAGTTDVTSSVTNASNVSAVVDGSEVRSNQTTVDVSGLQGSAALASYSNANGDTQYVIDVKGDGSGGYLNANIDAKTGVVTAGTTDVSSDVSSAIANGGSVTTGITGAIKAQSASSGPLARLDAALKKVDNFRSDLGAVQNRFDSAITNIDSTSVNLSSARSRITDADYATEVSNLSKAKILQQAGQSVLAQANQTSQGVITLLRSA